MRPEDAEEYTQALGQVVAGGWRQVALGKRLGVPRALGLSVNEWVEERLGGYVRMSIEERREAARELAADGESQRAIANVLGVDPMTINRDLKSVANATPDPDAELLTSHDADTSEEPVANATPMPLGQERADVILADIDEQVNTKAELHPLGAIGALAVGEVREAEARKAAARTREPTPVADPVLPPAGKYQCIVIDPPWPVQKIERDERPDQGVRLDYSTMPIECRQPCEGLSCTQTGWDYRCDSIECTVGHVLSTAAFEDCHLYLWVTQKYLPAGLDLMTSWGFRYQCVMTWRKNVGITPYSWMYDTEHVLFGRRGNLPLTKLGLRLSFDASVQGHSVKPDVFYDRVREASPGPRLDMFPGVQHEGFEPWGLEASHRGNG